MIQHEKSFPSTTRDQVLRRLLRTALLTILVASTEASGVTAPRASAQAQGTEVRFRFRPPANPQTVSIAGTFNDWNPSATPLADGGGGLWETTLHLNPGSYQYKFVVDGNTWFTDEHAEDFAADGFGGRNSVLQVGDAPLVAGEPLHTSIEPTGIERTFAFRPSKGPVNAVSIAGSFNGWNAAAHPMSDDDRDGVWEITLRLDPGEYRYQFVVDGDGWTTDESASRHESDGFGGKNAVIRVGHGG